MQPIQLRAASLVTFGLLLACASQPAVETGSAEAEAAAAAETTRNGNDVDPAVENDIARIREATEAFKSLDKAVAAGYQRDITVCVDNPPAGAMGYHHQNNDLLDDKIEVERPEMLVYERMPDGEYRLNGVEYIIPFSVWPADREPPVVMGQELKPAPSLNIWYRHVWVWRDNPSGMFADWNPLVKC